MKKIVIILAAVLLLASIGVGILIFFGRDGVAVPINHDGHTKTAAWNRDGSQHWHDCDCGGKQDAGEHTLDEENVCTVCGNVVIPGGDRTVVEDFDESGRLHRVSQYFADGQIYEEIAGYDAEGNMYAQKEISIGANNDGSHRREKTYDEDGRVLADCSYDEAGKLLWKLESEYSTADDGSLYCSKSVGYSSETGETIVTTFTFDGSIESQQRYNDAGELLRTIRYEQDYDEEGNMLWQKQYVNDKLYCDTVFDYWETGGMKIYHVSTVTIYRDDGTKSVSQYNKYEEIVSTTTYDADGNVLEHVTKD